MSALQHIKDYLAIHCAGHDIETLMTHFETAIEAKVEEAIEGVRAEIAALHDELTGKPTPTLADVFVASAKPPEPEAEETAEAAPQEPAAQPEATTEATDGSVQ